MKPSPKPLVRCAIYTRKSTDEGLDQAFNSLHAQREACEAYVLSQASEGWTALPTLYDDGGFSGGNMDRPALARLLDDIGRGLVDTVVVYKIDRLTRSLADFAKIVERLDGAGASFVSVTQAFNTTTSMGRLTLNVLLSFAQFEREVTGERIRDKIAASKAKGMWMGGNLPLGYDAPDDPATRALVVNPTEAQTVRAIFSRYLELGSVGALQGWLSAAGIVPKVTIFRSGRRRGAATFSRGALFHLLKNRTYLGEIPHRDSSYPGRHAAIVDADLFAAVQTKLAAQRTERRSRPLKSAAALLKGKLLDAKGRPMTPTFTRGRDGQPYRYYVAGAEAAAASASRSSRISAGVIEDYLHEVVRRLLGAPEAAWSDVAGAIGRVQLQSSMVIIDLAGPGARGLREAVVRDRLGAGETMMRIDGGLRIEAPAHMRVRGGRTWLVDREGRAPACSSKTNPSLIRGLKAARTAAKAANIWPELGAEHLRAAAAPVNVYDRKLCMLAFLAPDIQRAILDGQAPRSLTLEQLMREDLPLVWSEQRRVLGFA